MAVSRTDFSCPCCGGNQISDKVVSLVKDIEKELGSSITITSGYRCKSHNKKVGGASNSQHLLGNAADITAHLSVRQSLFDLCQKKYQDSKIGGLGVYSTFRHVDIGTHRTWKG